MSYRSAAMAFLSIITGYCVGLALVYAGTDNTGVKEVICEHISLILKLRSGKFAKIQKSQQGSCIFDKNQNYSTGFLKACGDKSSKILLEMFLSCLTLAAGVVSSGSGSKLLHLFRLPSSLFSYIIILGDVNILRLVREARLKSEESSYGTHMAFSMAAG
jgi:hypothetical protein